MGIRCDQCVDCNAVEGYGGGKLWRSLVLQAVLLIGVDCGTGGAFGLLGQRLIAGALTDATGFPVVNAPAWSIALLTSVAAIVVAIVAVVGHRAAKVDPDEGVS